MRPAASRWDCPITPGDRLVHSVARNWEAESRASVIGPSIQHLDPELHRFGGLLGLVEIAPADRADHARDRGEPTLAPEDVERDVAGRPARMIRRPDHTAEGGVVIAAGRGAGVRLALAEERNPDAAAAILGQEDRL